MSISASKARNAAKLANDKKYEYLKELSARFLSEDIAPIIERASNSGNHSVTTNTIINWIRIDSSYELPQDLSKKELGDLESFVIDELNSQGFEVKISGNFMIIGWDERDEK